jgi:FkbM family methyltransferase
LQGSAAGRPARKRSRTIKEENLTFERADSADTRRGATAPQASDEEENESRLYEFTGAQIAHGEIRQDGDTLVLTTDPRQWFYTVVIPVGTWDQRNETVRFRVALEVRVEIGVVQIGILNREDEDFRNAAAVGQSPDWQVVTLNTPPLNQAGPLVIRNAADTGPSRARCRLVSVVPISAPEPEYVSATGASLEEVAFQSSQIRAAIEALEPHAAADSTIARAVGTVARYAALGLRRPLAQRGLAVIDICVSGLETMFAGLDTAELRHLATHFSVLTPLRPFPGWRFDSFLESGDLATFIRYGVWLALRGRPEAGSVRLNWHAGTQLDVQFGNDMSLAIFVGGCFEPNEFAFLNQILRPGMAVIDAGANEGAYTTFLAARVGREGRVIAVEPSPRELVCLRANLELNHADWVDVVPAALVEQKGEVSLLLADNDHAGQNTLGELVYPGVRQAGRASVQARTLDDVVETHRLDRLDVIKLDVEGAEIRALAGGARVLERSKPLLLLEAFDAALQRQDGSVRGLLERLAEIGYISYCFDPATGLPTRLQSDPTASDNLVAVHAERRFGL